MKRWREERMGQRHGKEIPTMIKNLLFHGRNLNTYVWSSYLVPQGVRLKTCEKGFPLAWKMLIFINVSSHWLI